MKKIIQVLAVVLVELVCCGKLAAHPDPFFIQQYDNRNGLSNSSINHIYKDEDNLLWIATWDGLNMYDGSIFHVFNYSKENNSNNIGSNVIQQVTEDHHGNIWVTTIEGISRYEKRTGKFYNYFYNQSHRTRVSEQEYALLVDSSGNVYCLSARSGFSRYDRANDSFRTCNLAIGAGKVAKAAFDGSNRCWVLDVSGRLTVYQQSNNDFKPVYVFGNEVPVKNFFCVNNRVFFSSADRLFTVADHNLGKTELMKMAHRLTSIIYYRSHYLLAWSTKGFSVYDANMQASGFLQAEVAKMQDVKISSWALGSEDILWFGTDGNGMIRIYPRSKPFGTVALSDNSMVYNRAVRSFCAVGRDLWIGTKGSGIITMKDFWSPAGKRLLTQQHTAPGEIDNNAVYALTKGNEGLIYIGSDAKGVGVYDMKAKRFIRWQEVKGHNDYAEFGSVYAIKQDADNSLWLGTSGYGLVHLKIDRSKKGQLELAFLRRFTFNNDSSGPANDIIYSLADGENDELWVGCRYGGLSVLNKRTLVFKTFKALSYEGSLSNNDVLSLFRDSRQQLWIGTSYGLNRIKISAGSQATPVFEKFTTADGLPNNTIHGIEEDSSGQVWVSTNKGLAKVGQPGGQVFYYQQADGLQSNEFCDGAVWKDPQGTVFFGGTYGFNHFLPHLIHGSTWQPNLLLSGFLVGGKPLAAAGIVVMQPGRARRLDLSVGRRDNFFELDVRAVSFLNAEKCEYAYFLEGYDPAWRAVGTNGKLVYANIPPGDYRLFIRWSNGEGAWTADTQLMHIKVLQYPWLSYYALALYAGMACVLGLLLYRYRKNKQEIRHQLAMEHLSREKEEQIHQQRLAFFTNIAHELQTPLTLIMGAAERFQEKSAPATTQKAKPYFLSLIHQQAARLTLLVQQLLEFRKVEAGFLKNECSFLDVSALIQNLAEPFIALSEQQGMEYELNIQRGISGWIDKDKLEKIIFNLLSNAFKHSGPQEQVVFEARENTGSGQLEITVSNSGVDLSETELQRLFENFYVVASNGLGSEKFGTGIGLAFTRQLVTLLNGKIGVVKRNESIEFSVLLPLAPERVPATDASPAGNSVAREKPSYLYRTVTSYPEPSGAASSLENNKQAIIEQLHGQQRPSVLIVEDDRDIRFLLNDLLKEEYIVYEATDGQKALELIERVLPAIVICDVMMPNMSGLELCNIVKNAPATCHVPFIILSARGSEEHHMEGYEAGADAYISKPFHAAHLKLRIRKLLAYREKLQELFKNGTGAEELPDSELSEADKSFLAKLAEVVDEHLAEAGFNGASLEKELNMSKMQLYRRLKTMTGMTPGEFIRQVRLKHAATLLVSTSLNVTEIFYRTGFNNQSYFFREFRKRYDCAPNEFRERECNLPARN